MCSAFGKVFQKRIRQEQKFIEFVYYLDNDRIVICGRYLASHQKDTDLVTHELMHIVQQYPGNQPGWLVEGIADYVRWKYGVDNAGGNWQLPSFQSRQRYTDSYRVTARFLVWLEQRVNKDIVNQLDRALRQNKYNNGQIWNQITKKSVNQLWDSYSKSPNLQN
ncbi:unnamed protein product [Adineta ricciae]|uniref:Uncharacterized protein n=1 Tax=Adineta ricciae TaxID=249248 RepID=A0A815X7S4_ADIRI|nr:unnamed protein product [Adineta ricciae]CAF1554052.1 unnamed protein product [Adineta ricciae]